MACRHRNKLPILIMISVVSRRPRLSTYITKLITTSTSHMITSLILFNNKLTLFTLSVVKIALEKIDLLGIAFAHMNCKQAFCTANILTALATHNILSCSLQNTFTILPRTQFYIGIFECQIKLTYFSVIFLNIYR